MRQDLLNNIIIRPFQAGDEAQLFEVFHSSIHELASKYYDQIQINAWAPDKIDTRRWQQRMQILQPYVLTCENQALAYADLQDNGYIDHFFVSGKHARSGLGRLLMRHIISRAEEKGIQELSAHVSLSAQDFFAGFDFKISKQEVARIGEVELKHALMIRSPAT